MTRSCRSDDYAEMQIRRIREKKRDGENARRVVANDRARTAHSAAHGHAAGTCNDVARLGSSGSLFDKYARILRPRQDRAEPSGTEWDRARPSAADVDRTRARGQQRNSEQLGSRKREEERDGEHGGLHVRVSARAVYARVCRRAYVGIIVYAIESVHFSAVGTNRE